MILRYYKALALDTLLFICLSSPILIFIYTSINTSAANSLNHSNIVFSYWLYIVLGFNILLVIFWLIFKDALKLSLGKKIMNLTIIDKKTRKEAPFIKKIMRNIPFILFPLFEILKILTPQAKFGDLITDTKLIYHEHY